MDKEDTKIFLSIIPYILGIVILAIILYFIFRCPECHYLVQRGWYFKYCGHCGYKF